MYIKRILISNFRSIINEEFTPANLNIFVGDNDIGKSNILRALNLFFNGETSFGQKFNFQQDFSNNATVPKKKAREIKIAITFQSPANYKENRDITWTKKWRLQGLHSDEKKYSDGAPLEGRKKVGYWLDQIRFRYVPAIKGPSYFSELLSDLHDVLAQTISDELRAASSGFIEKIRQQTQQVSINLFDKLGIESKLQIPDDLSALFQILEFETDSGIARISLNFRGDGIKVRHIPVILKFIAEQENANKQKGSPKINTIWGYEEPENNLELSKAFDKAEDLCEYSSDVQIFLTTHSPAFYSLARKDSKFINSYFVKKNDFGNSILLDINSQSMSEVDTEMGLLPLITPHIKDVLHEKKELLNQIDILQKAIDEIESNTLFVEGPSDKAIIEKAFKILMTEKQLNFKITHSSKNGGGHSWVKDMMNSWHYNREKRSKNLKCAGLFDYDFGTINSLKKLTADGELKNVKAIKLREVIPNHLISILTKKINFPFAIEEFFKSNVIQHAKDSGWLIQKQDLLNYNGFLDIFSSFRDHYRRKGVTEKDELYFFKINEENKKDFVDYVCSPEIATKSNYDGFDKLLKAILESLE